LTGGTLFTLELAQHITSGRTPVGSRVYFHVANDVTAQGQTVIRKGTLVEGRMQAIGDRGMVGVSGSMNFGVRYVPAVDGQRVRVLATASNKGRSRDGAMVGWVFMWGIFGLTTQGVDAFALRGAELEAEVLTDRDIKPTPPEPAVEGVAGGVPIPLVGAHLGNSRAKEIDVSLERASEHRPLVFELPDLGPVKSATLTSVNGIAPAEPVTGLATSTTELQFSMWDVIKYCNEGDNTLMFLLQRQDGQTLAATYVLPVDLKHK
jgi:hypothetical protein